MALLQKVLHGPEVVPARQALRMATIGGAKALGLDSEIGSLEVGKRADVIVVNVDSLHSTPHAKDLVSSIVYSGQTSDVQSVVIDGEVVMKDRELTTLSEDEVLKTAALEATQLSQRAGTSI